MIDRRRLLASAAALGCAAFGTVAVARAAGSSGPASAAVAAAAKEGTVTWYTTMNTQDLNRTVDAFQHRYPQVHVQTLRMGSEQLPARVITEQRGGAYNADVISGDGFQMSQLVAAGALQKHDFPDRAKFLPFTTDPNGFWVTLYQNTTVTAWNPQRLAADHLTPPRSPDDLASPAWKGKVGIDSGALNWYLGIVQTRKDGEALMRRIAANGPQLVAGHTAAVTQLENGEYDVTPTAYGYLAYDDKQAGKPVDFRNPNPVFVTLNPIGIAKRAPHPAAAALLADWLTSREGQQFIASEGGGNISARTDVRNNASIWNPKEPYIVVPAPDPAKYNQAVKSFKAIFGIAG